MTNTYSSILTQLTADGWVVVNESSSGAQLKLPKKMRTQTKWALGIGAVLVLVYGLGLLVMAFALIDYAVQKDRTHFLSREAPTLPPAK